MVVACSGGADSIGLLVLAADAGLVPTAVYVDHGLRADSAADADVVTAAARDLGVEWRVVRVEVTPGGNLEARARTARYAALHDARRALGATAILVGHTADDQAETVLLNLLRGSASAGLAGMAPRRGPVARPLLAVRRAEVRAVAASRGLSVVDDPTNADTRWRRAWIRHDVLPLLERGSQRDLVPILTRQAEVFRAESDFLDGLGDELLGAASDPSADGLAVDPMRSAPEVVVRRAVRRWVGSPPPSADEVERIVAVVRGDRVACELSGGRRVRRTAGRVQIDDPRQLP
ncbi:MAG: tRNA lysidine(34) synthetase TilS [Acidimicrobiia bacterium]